MQQLAQDEAGNIWVVDAAGNPVRLHQAAGAAPSQGRVFSLPQDPVEAAREAAKAGREAAGEYRETVRFNERNKPTLPAGYRMGANGVAERIPGLPPEKGSEQPISPEQQRGMTRLANDEILSAIAKARNDLNRFGATGFGARLPELLQTQGAVDLGGSLNTIASRLTLDKLAQLKQASPTGASGLGSLTEREGALLRDSVAGLGQSQSADRLLQNLAEVEKHYRNFMALTAGEDYRDPKVAAKYGIAAEPDDNQSAGLARGQYREEADPALRGVNNRIRSLIGAGATAGEIVDYMNSVQPGLGDQRAADVRSAVTFRAQNPTVPLSRYPISVENRQVPMSDTRQRINSLAQSPFGAAMIAAGDVASFGTLDNLQGNPALARAGMAQIAEDNPTASLIGTIGGGLAAGGGLEAMAGRAGATWAPRIADAAFGALYGAGSADEGSRLGGAGLGAATGVAGGVVGRGLARAGGNALTGVRDEAAQLLRERGVPLTIGQATANAGIFGRRIKAREDRLSGFGGIGDTINTRRRGGLEAFNRAAYDEALAPINAQAMNQVGENAVETATDAVSNEYDRVLGPIRLRPDAQFAADLGPVGYRAAQLPGDLADNARYTLNQRVGASLTPQAPAMVAPNGATALPVGATMTGRNFQQSVRGLEGDARAVRNQPYGTDFGNVARDARSALEGMLERQAPGALDDYLSANTAYRNTSVLADATASAMNTDGVFTPAQLGQAARANARKFTGRTSAATTDRPFFELQRAGQQILPSKVPDSGTAGRADTGDMGLTATIRRTARNAFNAPLYAEGLQEPLNRLLLDRPDILVAAGEAINRRARLGGLFGRPLALQYGPESVVAGY